MKLLAVEDAQARMLAEIAPLTAETIPLRAAIGRVLAEDVTAVRDQPPFDASAMDGWAVRSGDTPGPLRIIGESAAGHGFEGVLGAGEAVRIFTGAAVPVGADAIVIQEDAERDGETVTTPEARAGQHQRRRGGDFTAGQVLLSAGQRIDPWRLSLAASAGRAEVSVRRAPKVAIISTGEEIVEAPGHPGPFQIYDSGAPALLAMVQAWGAEAEKLKPVRDELDAVIAALAEAQADLIVTVGGASVGDHDLVRAAGEALGLKMKVASVAVRPGKPTFFGVLADGRRMLGLPGNPASAFVCAELFLRPILRAYQGDPTPFTTMSARAAESLSANGPREHWMRARLVYEEGMVLVHPYRDQDSSLVSVFAGADALLRRPPGAPAVEAGGLVEVLPLARA
ncbi:gephyrin-like molybdotransferase Glp [Phenylobacterium sp.]|uniref:molybdopterin molybdotransferase MoeA n=1 Tax=Phenylobacterium sp. TaxID=1871053 RepID=UPI00272F4AEE|nr:gephyrin-like molybdotransferase Glp [Phenylobacterium sp.]MDP1873473.1 molybdopterin molybdotransferase MoeA [Phenylobacterium sp.]MDP3298750.1 molybdopterin molybdotransferase MoeA [Phenylobacterium sp.]